MRPENKSLYKFIGLLFAPFVIVGIISGAGKLTTTEPVASGKTADISAACKTDWTKCTWQDQEIAIHGSKLVAQIPATPPAQSREDNTATGIATFIAYDLKCEHMPLVFNDMSEKVAMTIPADILKTAFDKVLSFYRSTGPAAFCSLNKPVIEEAMRNFR